MSNNTCATDDCDRHVTARGLCRMHYLREYRAGTHTTRPTRAARPRTACPPDHAHDAEVCWAVHGCRCGRCGRCVHARAMERQRRRNRLRAYGRADQIGADMVPAQPVREHVERLHEHGLGYERIGRAAGVGHGPIMDLIYGPRGTRTTAPAVTIRKDHADALLALTVDQIDAALVDPTGTERRVRALVAIGWTESHLADRIGMHVGNLWGLIHGRRGRITARTRDTVAAVFTELWDQPQVGGAADRARRLAKHYGWVGPLAWDNIDDPTEQPEGVASARGGRGAAADYLDDVAFLLELGESPHQVARIVGRSPAAIAKAAARYDRPQITAAFYALTRKAAA